MNPDYNADPYELWAEYDDSDTTFERRIEILFNFALFSNRAHSHARELLYIETAIEMGKQRNLTEHLTMLASFKIRILNDLRRYREALDLAIETEATLQPIALEYEELNLRSGILLNKANALRLLKRYAEAIHIYDQYIDVQEMQGNETYSAWAHEHKAMCFIEIEDFDAVHTSATQARQIYLRHDKPVDVADVDVLLGRVLLAKKQTKLAIKLLKEARDAQRALRGSSSLRAKLYLGLAYVDDGQVEKAEKWLSKAIDAGKNSYSGDYEIFYEASMALADLYDALLRVPEARSTRNEAQAVIDRLSASDNNAFSADDIDYLLQNGDADTAKALAETNILQAAETGDINEYWQAQYLTVRASAQKRDFEAVVAKFDSLNKASLDARDEIVIEFKNLCSYALFKLGRLDEAFEVNAQVLADSRLEPKLQEAAYAKENLAKFLKSIKQTTKANKSLKEAVQLNLQVGNMPRAFELLEEIGKREPRKPKSKQQNEKESPDQPDSY